MSLDIRTLEDIAVAAGVAGGIERGWPERARAIRHLIETVRELDDRIHDLDKSIARERQQIDAVFKEFWRIAALWKRKKLTGNRAMSLAVKIARQVLKGRNPKPAPEHDLVELVPETYPPHGLRVVTLDHRIPRPPGRKKK